MNKNRQFFVIFPTEITNTPSKVLDSYDIYRISMIFIDSSSFHTRKMIYMAQRDENSSKGQFFVQWGHFTP